MSMSVLYSAALRGLPKNCSTVSVAYCPVKNFGTSTLRHISFKKLFSTKQSTASKLNFKTFGPKEGFLTIYRLPMIARISRINKFKRQQTIIQPLLAPVVMALSYTGIAPPDLGLILCITGLAVCIKLYLLGYFTTNLVGAVYVSPDLSTVQIAYTDFWGRRKEDVFASSDIVPLSELPPSFLDSWYRQLRRYSQPTSGLYKLNLSHGKITDIDKFSNIFGKVD